MNGFVTTNIRIPEEDYLRLKEEALQKRKSLGAVIREKITRQKPENFAKTLLTINGSWFSLDEMVNNRKAIERRLRRSYL